MDELAASTLATLKKASASAEAKITAVNALKSSIKHQRVPESAQNTAVECLRLAITSPVSSSLVAAGFSALGHLVKRLTLQDQTAVLFSKNANLLGILLERLSDNKEALRAAASSTLGDLWVARPLDVETKIKEGALQSNSAKAKIEGIQWVTNMHESHDLQFKNFVPAMVECLEDADGTVRDSAKHNLVGLFRDARDAAKADLKRQLIAFNVRRSIAEYILSQLQLPVPKELSSSHSAAAAPETPHRRLAEAPVEPSLPPSADLSNIEPLYVYATRELEDMFRQMQPCFEDRESEGNWKNRDNNVLKMRRLLKGNAPSDHLAVLVASIKQTLDGILKVATSLRTTMSTNGCHLIQELARTLGPSLDPMAEIILRSIEKMCAATKHIAAQNANLTVEAVFSNVSYSTRLMQHVHDASGDKNVQPRQFAAGWLRIILKKHAHNRSHFEHSGGLELAEKCIKKGLLDANPKVRELMRGTYWAFASMWPDKAQTIASTLDAKSRGLLEKDAANPNGSSDASTFTRSVGPDYAANPRVPSTARASLKDAIAAQRNAARRMPERPASAMSTVTPSRQAPASASRPVSKMGPAAQARVVSGSASSTSKAWASSTSASTTSTSTSTSTGHGSLMSAPVRRPRKVEGPRPATADPYGGRNANREETPPRSPVASARKVSNSAIPSRPSAHSKSKSTNTIGGTSNSATSSRTGSPRTSPIKVKSRANLVSNLRADTSTVSPPREDNFTMVIPDGKMPFKAFVPRTRNNENDRPGSGHSSQLGTVDEDNFTMVIPEKSKYTRSISSTLSASQEPRTNLLAGAEDRKDDAVMVYEDPAAEDVVISATEEKPVVVLEEKAPNEQNLLQKATDPSAPLQASTSSISSPSHSVKSDNQNEPGPRSLSPTKKTVESNSRNASPTKRSPFATETPQPDRAEILKTRRLLASGTERVKAHTLDAHGFRRLQELIKAHARTDDIRFAPLLASLCDYCTHSPTSHSVESTKDRGLRGQALGSLRAIVTLCASRDEDVRAALPSVLLSIAFAASTWVAGLPELEKASDEVLRKMGSLHDAALLSSCMDALATFIEGKAANGGKSVGIVLQQLCKVIPLWSGFAAANAEGGDGVGEAMRARLARLAVKTLKDLDAEVRRRGVEFAVVLYGTFPAQRHAGQGGAEPFPERKERFWEALRPAGEQSCNLVAYYLARRGRVDGV